MRFFQVIGIPGNKVELLEYTPNGMVKLRDLGTNKIIETTQHAFEMAFEATVYSVAANEKEKTKVLNKKLTQKDIDTILEKSQMEIFELFGKCTLVAVKLQNGFIITESTACDDPANYNKETNIQICLERIKNKIWEFETYNLQSMLTD
ncbi:Gp49 family protein [Neobacillus ginsengisoli]|uniref:Uncharacterized protein n=1 Tax=Neobacillus ginsengisoli TaxID=904295 RepID=A0ABT9XY15_9BACI|nr:Gp49 family protein [Neobacillus ginsengisoli]MDQ0200463.1 hypothetical protein [Neobacillus ginsengisoli]